jgi:hypothetical protein
MTRVSSYPLSWPHFFHNSRLLHSGHFSFVTCAIFSLPGYEFTVATVPVKSRLRKRKCGTLELGRCLELDGDLSYYTSRSRSFKYFSLSYRRASSVDLETSFWLYSTDTFLLSWTFSRNLSLLFTRKNCATDYGQLYCEFIPYGLLHWLHLFQFKYLFM